MIFVYIYDLRGAWAHFFDAIALVLCLSCVCILPGANDWIDDLLGLMSDHWQCGCSDIALGCSLVAYEELRPTKTQNNPRKRMYMAISFLCTNGSFSRWLTISG